MRMTISQMMKLVVFAAFACLGPTPILQAYRMGVMPLGFALIFSLPLACVTCIIPAVVLTRGMNRLWLVRLILGLGGLCFVIPLGVVLGAAYSGILRASPTQLNWDGFSELA